MTVDKGTDKKTLELMAGNCLDEIPNIVRPATNNGTTSPPLTDTQSIMLLDSNSTNAASRKATAECRAEVPLSLSRKCVALPPPTIAGMCVVRKHVLVTRAISKNAVNSRTDIQI